MNSYVERTRPALSFVDIGIAPRYYPDASYCPRNPGNSKDQALRTETTVNNSRDFGLNKNLSNLEALRSIGHQVNARLLETERVSQNCVLDQAALDRLQRPSLDEGGLRAPALRFGDGRVMALFQAVCRFAHLPDGFRNRDIRSELAALLGLSLDLYNTSQDDL